MAVLLVFLGLQVVDAVVSEAALQIVMDASSIDDASRAISTGSLGLGAGTIGMKVIYAFAIMSMGILVSALYRHRSTAVIVRIMIYLLALCLIKINVRYVFEEYSFDFPKFLTALHFLFSGLICSLLMLSMPSLRSTKSQGAVLSWRCMVFKICPLAVVFASSIGAGNAALVYANTSFVEMMSSCTPACTVVVAILLNQPFQKQLLWPVLVVCVGLIVCAAGVVEFSLIGCVLSLLATLLRAFKAVLQQILMGGGGGGGSGFDPVQLLGWMSLPSVVLMLTWSFVSDEGWGPYASLAGGSRNLFLCIGLTCINACILNVMATFVVKDLGAVAAQLTGQLKGLVTVLGGIALLKETVCPQQVIGYSLVMLGIFWYTSMESGLKAQEKEQKERDPERPEVGSGTAGPSDDSQSQLRNSHVR